MFLKKPKLVIWYNLRLIQYDLLYDFVEIIFLGVFDSVGNNSLIDFSGYEIRITCEKITAHLKF